MNVDTTKVSIFYKEFRQMNPYLVLGLMIISFGLYVPVWIYSKNSELQLLDRNAPNPARGAIILMALPFTWLYMTIIMKTLVTKSIIFDMIEIGFWGFIIFLILKYILDFCLSFGRITKTNGIYWFVLMVVPFLTIPAMQSEINSYFDKIIMKKKMTNFYE